MRIASALVALALVGPVGGLPVNAEPIAITISGGRVIATARAGNSSPRTAPADSTTAPYIVPRYDNGRVEQRVEFDDNTCKFISSGTANIIVQGQFGVATTGTPPCTVPPDYPYCPGTTYPACSVVYYTRIQHNNKSIRPDKTGAVDTFTYHWTTPDKYWDVFFPVYVASPVVRPTGETNEWTGWQAGSGEGKWLPTLTPPDTDKTFDFSGETVREVHLSRTTTCTPKTSGTLGNPKQRGSLKPTTEATWEIVGGNKFDHADGVGWQPCAVQFYRCTKAAPCDYTVKQSMQIKSPADTDFTEYTVNILKGGIAAPMGPFFDAKSFIGLVSSVRGKEWMQWHLLKTDKNSCIAYPNASFSC